MPLHLTKANQDQLLTAALSLTDSAGWKRDAIAFAARRDRAADPVAIGVFQNFGAGEADLHFGVTAPHMTKGVIEAFKSIAFHKQMLGLSLVWIQVAADNTAALRAAIGAGFQIEFRKRGGFGGAKDAIVLSLAAAKAPD